MEPTREQIEARIVQLELLLRGDEFAIGWETDLAVYRLALRALDADAAAADMRERAVAVVESSGWEARHATANAIRALPLNGGK